MFVSEEEAHARLRDKTNLLREGTYQERPSSDPHEATGSSGTGSGEPASAISESGDDWEEPQLDDNIELPTLRDHAAELDQLIRGGANFLNGGRAHYAGKRTAQRAIAETSLLLGSSAAGRALGVSAPQTWAYEHGLQTTNPDQPEIAELRAHIENVKLDIAAKAVTRLHKIVNSITDQKIDAVDSPVVLTRMGKDMAAIVERVTPRAAEDTGAERIHVYRPEVSTVNEYNIVNVNVSAAAAVKKDEQLTEREQSFLKRVVNG